MRYLTLITFLFISTNLYAKNINITFKADLNLNCVFEKVIIKNTEHNFVSFTSDSIYRKDINHLIIKARNPDTLIINNLSKFINDTSLEVKIANKDIILIQAFDKNRNYSESAVYTRKTGEFIHEITKEINSENKEKDISFYSCKKNNQNS